jgi:hypothetical protein
MRVRPKRVVKKQPAISVSFPAKACAVRTATAQTSRRFLSSTKKASLVQLPTLDSAPSRWAAVARICWLEGRPREGFNSPSCLRG